MKKEILLLLFIFCLFSCKEKYEYDFSNGKTTIQMDGKNMVAEAVGGFESKSLFSSSFLFRDEIGLLSGHFYIAHIPYPPVNGKYNLSDNGASNFFTYYAIVSDDVLLETYKLKPDSVRSVCEITNFNSINGFISGKINAVFVKDSNSSKNIKYPDTIVFSNGNFDVRSKY